MIKGLQNRVAIVVYFLGKKVLLLRGFALRQVFIFCVRESYCAEARFEKLRCFLSRTFAEKLGCVQWELVVSGTCIVDP